MVDYSQILKKMTIMEDFFSKEVENLQELKELPRALEIKY